MTIRSLLYDANGHDETVEVIGLLVEGLADNQLLWIDVEGRCPPILSPLSA